MGNCCKILSVKTAKPSERKEKRKNVLIKDSNNLDASNVEILHEDGNTELYYSKFEKNEEINPSELLFLYVETFDKNRSEIQITAGEKVSVLRTKIRANLGLDEFIIVLDGRILEDNKPLNKYKIFQGAVIDIVPA